MKYQKLDMPIPENDVVENLMTGLKIVWDFLGTEEVFKKQKAMDR